jgi:hypothetical protein
MKRRDWIRLYCRMIDSPEVLELEDSEFRLLVGLWCLAGSADEPGIVRYTLRGLQRRLMPHHDEPSVARMLERLVELDLLRPLADGPGYAIPRWEQHQYSYPSWLPEAQAARRRARRAMDDQVMIKQSQDHDQAMINASSSEPQTLHNAAHQHEHRQHATAVHDHAIDDGSRETRGGRARSKAVDLFDRALDHTPREAVVREEKARRDAENDDREPVDHDQAMIKRRSSDDQACTGDDQRKNKNKNKNEIITTCMHDSLRAERSASRARRSDPLFEALVESVYGKSYTDVELTRSERGRVNEAVRQLREIGADAGAVREKAALYRARWPGVELTPTALVKHWHLLETTVSTSPRTLVPRATANGRRSNLEIALATLQELAEGKGG